MTAMQLIMLAINASMFLIVFALGLHATLENATFLFRHPRLFVRSVLSMNIAMLAFALLVCVLFDPPPAIKIALVALAVSPVPPVLPGKQFKAGGSAGYTIGLLVGAALVAIVLVPLEIEVLGRVADVGMHMPIAKVTSIVLVSIVVPLLAGVAIRHLAPSFAQRAAHPISLFATVLLIAACLPVLFVETPLLWTLVGNGVLACLVLFTLVGIAVGHFLGGPEHDDRTVLALATATRHPGIAIAIASINFPDQKVVMAIVLYHLVVGTIVSLPYVRWRKRTQAA